MPLTEQFILWSCKKSCLTYLTESGEEEEEEKSQLTKQMNFCFSFSGNGSHHLSKKAENILNYILTPYAWHILCKVIID